MLGIFVGANISLSEVCILYAMETLNSLTRSAPIAQCSFIKFPNTINTSFIPRNYDYPAPFDKIAEYLIVTISFATDLLPVAIIGLPCQIYCPTCINSENIFMELNIGMPSGGFFVDRN
jgi:hypothetical protein